MTTAPCFVNCGKAVCRRLGCLRVLADEDLEDEDGEILSSVIEVGCTRRQNEIFTQILQERRRQATLRDSGRFQYTLADEPGMLDEEKLLAVLEEVAEIGKAILGRKGLITDGGNLEKEILHATALLVAWLEAI